MIFLVYQDQQHHQRYHDQHHLVHFIRSPALRTLGRSWNHRTRTPSQLDIRVTRLPRARQLAGSLKAKRVGSGVLEIHEMTNKNTMITALGQRI